MVNLTSCLPLPQLFITVKHIIAGFAFTKLFIDNVFSITVRSITITIWTIYIIPKGHCIPLLTYQRTVVIVSYLNFLIYQII
jgi:hypothetical protein